MVNVSSTYRITEIFIDIKLSLAASSSLVKSAEQFECVAKVARGFSFTCLVTNYPSYIKHTTDILFIHCFSTNQPLFTAAARYSLLLYEQQL